MQQAKDHKTDAADITFLKEILTALLVMTLCSGMMVIALF
jgi:hypothetical protein